MVFIGNRKQKRYTMMHYTLNIFIQLILIISLGSSVDLKPILSSPIGPYQMVFKQIYNCNPTQNNKIQNNMYLSHKKNITMFFGNSTSTIPLDDNLSLEMKMAVKDSFGAWRENFYFHKSPNGCSSLKQLMGKAWPEFVRGYGFPSVDCPIPPGVHLSPGLDPLIYEKANFPKSFFYGTYKLHFYFSQKNEIFGCQVCILEIKRR